MSKNFVINHTHFLFSQKLNMFYYKCYFFQSYTIITIKLTFHDVIFISAGIIGPIELCSSVVVTSENIILTFVKLRIMIRRTA